MKGETGWYKVRLPKGAISKGAIKAYGIGDDWYIAHWVDGWQEGPWPGLDNTPVLEVIPIKPPHPIDRKFEELMSEVQAAVEDVKGAREMFAKVIGRE